MGLRDKLLSKHNRPYWIFVGLWTLGTLSLYSAVALVRTAGRSPSLPLITLIELLVGAVVLLVIGLAAFIVAVVLNFRSIYQLAKKRREQKLRQEGKLGQETPLPSQEGVWPPAPNRLPMIDSQSCDGNHDDPQEQDTQRSKKLPAIFFVGLWVVAILCFYIAITQLSAAHRGTEEIVLGIVHLVIGVVVLIMTLDLSLRNFLLAANPKRLEKQLRDTDPKETEA